MKFSAIILILTLASVAKSSPVSSETSHEPSFADEIGFEPHSHETHVPDVAQDKDLTSDNFLALTNGSHVAAEESSSNPTNSTLNVTQLTEKEIFDIPLNGTVPIGSNSEHVNGTIEHDGLNESEDNLGLKSFATNTGLDKVEDSLGFKAIDSSKEGTGLANVTTEPAIVVAGLNENVEADSVPINDSTNDPNVILDHKSPPATTINELEENGQPSVLDLHPVLSGNRTIKFRSGEPSEWRQYVENLGSFLEPYTKDAQERNVHCDFERVLSADQACRFDLVYLGPSCTKENNFGYAIGKPCVLISPAKIANWVPTAFDNESIGVPDEVQRLMRIFNSNFLFVTCEGEEESDRINIGPMAYLPPYQGFPSYFFPYKGDEVPNYVAPLMAVEFLNPTNGTMINVMCRAWARNIPDLPRQATLRFSLQVN